MIRENKTLADEAVQAKNIEEEAVTQLSFVQKELMQAQEEKKTLENQLAQERDKTTGTYLQENLDECLTKLVDAQQKIDDLEGKLQKVYQEKNVLADQVAEAKHGEELAWTQLSPLKEELKQANEVNTTFAYQLVQAEERERLTSTHLSQLERQLKRAQEEKETLADQLTQEQQMTTYDGFAQEKLDECLVKLA